MSGQKDLAKVLASLSVSCDNAEYGFATTKDSFQPSNKIIGIFQENEGTTIIASKDYFEEQGMNYEGLYAKLTIEVHTSLELIGLTAVLATKLAEKNISVNVFAAYYHDYIFVQHDKRKTAVQILESLGEMS